MGEIGTIFQNAILYVAGNEGLEKFNRAGHDTGTRKIMRPDGSLDLPQLMNILLDVFPEEQASAITDNVLAKYVEIASEEQKKAQVAVEGKRVEIEPAADDEPYEDKLAKYLATDTSDVRDLINEARRIRMAMGKPGIKPSNVPAGEKVNLTHLAPQEPVSPLSPQQDSVVPASADTLEKEIDRFVNAQKNYSSVGIMDFIRYLKGKGYAFQENIVQNEVYQKLEERKNKIKIWIQEDIRAYCHDKYWMSEADVSAYTKRLRDKGIAYEEPEIKRMVLIEMMRKI